MEQLYRARVEGRLSKAEALQRAQLALLHGTEARSSPAAQAAVPPRGLQTTQKPGGLPQFSPQPNAPWAHPYYWAPFILIGNSR